MQTFIGCIVEGILIGLSNEDNSVIVGDDIVPYIARLMFGKNAWIFERIIWPILNYTVQVLANGGPVMYFVGSIIGMVVMHALEYTCTLL